MLTQAVTDQRGQVVYRYPGPGRCSGTYRLIHKPCGKVPRGHAVWTCEACRAETWWPPACDTD